MNMNKADEKIIGNAENIFWAAAAQHQFMLPRCKETGQCFYYPREHSPFTGGEIEWVTSTGKGIIYSFCVSGRDEPYCLAYVHLDEGPIMLTNIIASDLEKIEIGLPVEVCYVPDESGRVVPFFTITKK